MGWPFWIVASLFVIAGIHDLNDKNLGNEITPGLAFSLLFLWLLYAIGTIIHLALVGAGWLS